MKFSKKMNDKKNSSALNEIVGLTIYLAGTLTGAFKAAGSLIFDNAKFTRRLTACAACFVFLGICGGQVSAQAIGGYYEADDGGAYFVRQIGDKIYWFGESPNGSYANVMAGTVSGSKIADNIRPRSPLSEARTNRLTREFIGSLLIRFGSFC